eukprot:TRINITY_DN4655_c0_g1_i1.p1 TRINITY_DN4655_c0_g1~~TRINITY_DN4655_c0_g1_i1.p1  ORF type:complete len:350 (+),score=25.90 TRINITY_DN4655_c0_g1_i1:64-1113(+)
MPVLLAPLERSASASTTDSLQRPGSGRMSKLRRALRIALWDRAARAQPQSFQLDDLARMRCIDCVPETPRLQELLQESRLAADCARARQCASSVPGFAMRFAHRLNISPRGPRSPAPSVSPPAPGSLPRRRPPKKRLSLRPPVLRSAGRARRSAGSSRAASAGRSASSVVPPALPPVPVPPTSRCSTPQRNPTPPTRSAREGPRPPSAAEARAAEAAEAGRRLRQLLESVSRPTTGDEPPWVLEQRLREVHAIAALADSHVRRGQVELVGLLDGGSREDRPLLPCSPPREKWARLGVVYSEPARINRKRPDPTCWRVRDPPQPFDRETAARWRAQAIARGTMPMNPFRV